MEYYYFPSNNPISSASSSSSSSIANNISNDKDRMMNNNKKNNTKSRSNNKGAVRLSTDPQSVAARERRHRISDRFKILQSLVPGGAKMDTVSMLEEAINYVKFLKTQILLHQTILDYSFQYDHLSNSNSNSMFLPLPQDHEDDQHYSLNYPQVINDVPEPHVLQPLPNTPLPIGSRLFQGQEITPFDPFMKHY